MCENSDIKKKILVVCTTDSMIWNFLIPHINHLKSKEYKVDCLCSKTGFYFNELKSEGINLYEVNFIRNPLNLKNIKNINLTRKIIKKNKYDLVFCHEPMGGVAGRIAGKLAHCKVIYMAHGFHFYNGSPLINWMLFYPVEWFLSLLTNMLITINSEDYIRSKKMPCKNTKYLNGIGLDVTKFKNDFTEKQKSELKKKINVDEEKKIILCVGELIKRKNHITVIKAMKQLNDNYVLCICGDGELNNEFVELIKSNHLEKKVHLLGFRKDVKDIYQIADVFCMPSYQEGLSVALMEAMSIGLPVVASNIRGNVDLIDSEFGGILVEVEDIDGYANAIKKALYKKKEFGTYNQNKILNFDIKTIKNKLCNYIEEII